MGFPNGTRGKEHTCQCRRHKRRDGGLIPELRRFLEVGSGNPLQYSFLENPTDRGAWWVTLHRITDSDTTEET